MKQVYRIGAFVVLVCFLLNTAAYGIDIRQSILRQNNIYNLAAALRCGALLDIETKDIGDIELWFTACLRFIDEKGFDITAENLRKVDHLPGNTIFHPEGAQFFIDEIKETENGRLKVMVRRKDNSYGLRTYYVEFSNAGDLKVYPKRKSKERTAKDAKSIEEGIRSKFADITREQIEDVKRAIDYMGEFLPYYSKLPPVEILNSIIKTNVMDQRRYNYKRGKERIRLPPTFIFDGKVFPKYKGITKPRFIVLTAASDAAGITTIFSRVQNPFYIFTKGGTRWYQEGQQNVESWHEKVVGNPKKHLDPLLPEGVRLAETQSYKNPFWEVYFGGGKTVFLAKRDADKERVIRDWTASSILAQALHLLYLAGPDTYMGYDEMAWMESEKVAARRQFKMRTSEILVTTSRDPSRYGTFPHEEWMTTSTGVVEMMLTALEDEEFLKKFNINPDKLTMAIPGFGDVGGGTIRYLAEFHPEIFRRIKIVLVADSKGAIYNAEGLDKKELLELIEKRAKMGGGFALKEQYLKDDPNRKLKFKVLNNDKDAYYTGATILVPAARNVFVDNEADIKRMAEAGTKLISEGANNFAAEGLEGKFEKYGIAYFYGAVANGGGIYSSKEEVMHALLEGPKSMRAHKDDRRIHIQGDIADIACANSRYLIRRMKESGFKRTIFDIHQEVVNNIINERARLLDNPTPREKKEILQRTALDFARGIAEVNDENERFFTIVNASEFARERVMQRGIYRDVVLRNLNSPKRTEKRTALYWVGKLRMKEAIPVVRKMLKDSSLPPHLRRLAAISLGYMSDREFAEAVIRDMENLQGELEREIELLKYERDSYEKKKVTRKEAIRKRLGEIKKEIEKAQVIIVGIEWARSILSHANLTGETIRRISAAVEEAKPGDNFFIEDYVVRTDEKLKRIVEKTIFSRLLKREGDHWIKPEKSTEEKSRDETILSERENDAQEVGEAIAPPVRAHTLFVPYNFYRNDTEYEKDKKEYNARCGLVKIGTDRYDKVIQWVLDFVSDNELNPANTIAQLPPEFANPKYKTQLDKLATRQIKFIIVKTDGLNKIKDKKLIADYRHNILQIMRLVRAIDKDTPKGSRLYRLLRFYIEGHLIGVQTNPALVDKYMDAIMQSDVLSLLAHMLSYKPVGRLKLKDYKLITYMLRFA